MAQDNRKIGILDKATSGVWDKSECDESMLTAFPNRYIEVKLSDKLLSESSPASPEIDWKKVEDELNRTGRIIVSKKALEILTKHNL